MKKVFALALLGSTFVRLTSAAFAAEPAPAAAKSANAPELPKRTTIDWEKMTFAQRKKYMKATVLPEMKKLFAAFDGKKYKEFTCLTCHGEKAVENKFKMPNAELPKLPQPTDRAGFLALVQKKPDVTKFMGSEVKPAVAAMLNLPESSPANPKAFGCFSCHTSEGGPAAPAAPAPAAAPPKKAAGGW